MASRREVLATSAVAVGATALPLSAGAPNARAAVADPDPTRPPGRGPNIVLIVLDDLGYGDLGCYGSSLIDTPNLDRLARQGTRFTQGYSGAPVCSPSRAALLTGRVPPRTGVHKVLSRDDAKGLRAREKTLPGYLRDAGYHTAAIGKWHLGRLDEHHPSRHGFDSYFGVDAMFSEDSYPTELWRDGAPVGTVRDEAELATLTRRFTDEAIDVVDRAGDRPFFLYLAEVMPHLPLAVEPEFAGRSRGGLYGDAVESVDHHLGRLFRALAKRGLERDTLVVVASDNGPWFEGSTGGLRGRKSGFYEGGVRVPFLMRWTGTVPRGRESHQVVSFLDLLPTLCGLAGVTPDPAVELDGTDLRTVLRGGRLRERPPVPFFLGRKAAAVRDGRWKLHVRRGGRNQRFLPELYDLEADPQEAANLAARRPEVTERLRTFLARLEEDVAAERRPPVALTAKPPLFAGRANTLRVRLSRALKPDGGTGAKVAVTVAVPKGWTSTTVRRTVDLAAAPVVEVDVTPPASAGAPAGRLRGYRLTPRVVLDGRTVTGADVQVHAVPHGRDAALALDAGPDGRPALPSYRHLTPATAWDRAAGFGWVSAPPESRAHDGPDPLRRGVVRDRSAAVLRLRLPAGRRRISLLRGDDKRPTHGFTVAADGIVVGAPGPRLPAGAYRWEEFILDGGPGGRTIELGLSGVEGNRWTLVALVVH
ncbi:sulfatase-like hydrolase/transferase [Streptomyces sp. 184]|uniref:sulfatase-like hydrolase/transferase n=1 Tax=Streptomyces sp. 184 TaxID=1827526 RepID=UPI003891559E